MNASTTWNAGSNVCIWTVGTHAFVAEMQSNRDGYCGVKFTAAAGRLTPEEKRLFFLGLIRAISYHKMPDRICLPLLESPGVRRLLPQ